MDKGTGRLGQSLVIKGHITASEDLTIAGRVEGTIDLHDHTLTVADTANISAEITAGTVRVMGTVNGNLLATEKVELSGTAAVKGDITAAQVAMAEGAVMHGRVDVQRPKEKDKAPVADRKLAVAV